jgi:hypothetical protein
MRGWSALRGFAVTALSVGCGDPAAHVQLVPVSLPNACGVSTAKTALRVIAYTPGGEIRRTVPPTDIDAFPADTEQLGVEVIGGTGSLVAVGKTGPLAFGDLDADIPIVMLPPNGFCATSPMTEPRVAPLVASAGNGVLVAGGSDASGERLSTAEYYDMTTATFSSVEVPPSLVDPSNGLAGGVLTALPDGRVVLSGTASHALAIFDPATRSFSTPSLFDHRAYHAAIAPTDAQLFIVGGCADVVDGACSGPSLRTGFTYELADLAERTRGPTLPDTRVGGQVFALGAGRDGKARYLLAADGFADRFTLAEETPQTISGLHRGKALLAGGALLTAQTGAASIVPPEADAPVAMSLAPNLDGASLVSLEDGSVAAIGSRVVRYVPTNDAWIAGASSPVPLDTPMTIRLADGSVLVLGGKAASAEAYLYRPSLVGETSGSVVALPDASTDGVIVAPDPRTAIHGGTYALHGDDARLLVGGISTRTGSVTAAVTVHAGGVALLARQTGVGDVLVARLVSGEAARIEDGQGKTLCSGMSVGELGPTLTFAIRGTTATVTSGSATLVTCEVEGESRGQWGVASVGADADIEVGAITVERVR